MLAHAATGFMEDIYATLNIWTQVVGKFPERKDAYFLHTVTTTDCKSKAWTQEASCARYSPRRGADRAAEYFREMGLVRETGSHACFEHCHLLSAQQLFRVQFSVRGGSDKGLAAKLQ
jgi:hypothetical protein